MNRAIDCLVNVGMGDTAPPEWMIRVKEDTFKAGESFLRSPELPELLDEMDANGVERAILMTGIGKSADRAQRYAAERPDRFSLGVGGFNLLRPMPALRDLASFVGDHPVSYAVVGPSFWGDGMYPPSDAVYYPLYVKCCELDLPLCVNTGIPGPPIPGEAQNPIHLDRVCIRFPELKLCMIHGADPWWDVAIRLMIKYRNLRLMTSAWSPKRLPKALLHYLATRGKDRILFASDHPVLSMQRCLAEIAALDLTPEVRSAWLYGNAASFFFGGAAPAVPTDARAPQDRAEERR
jgi:predicted TIM-barrel fold metal-dependent hydrolase